MREQQVDIRFPFLGVDISKGPFEQRPGTSPLGVNVRGYTTDFRKRGGSRPGLSPWFGKGSVEQVNGFAPVQSLTAVVWTTQAATFSSSAAAVIGTVDYSETDHPPSRDAPHVGTTLTWYFGTSPTREYQTGVVVGVPDGGGTGDGLASFNFKVVGTDVVLTATFIRAGFPAFPGPEYDYIGHGKTFSISRPASSFFSGGVLNSFWTVADFVHGWVAQYSFSFTGHL
jgi:hypothetical protein